MSAMVDFWGNLGSTLAPWLFLGFGFMIYYWGKTTERTRDISKKVALFVFIVALPYSFFTSGGIQGNVIFYVILMAAILALLVVVPVFWVLKLVDRLTGVKKDDAVGKDP